MKFIARFFAVLTLTLLVIIFFRVERFLHKKIFGPKEENPVRTELQFNQNKIELVGSDLFELSSRYNLTVEWKATNLSQETRHYGWRNKYLAIVFPDMGIMNPEVTIFYPPVQGETAEDILPGDSTRILKIKYMIPAKKIARESFEYFHWGAYDSKLGVFQYKLHVMFKFPGVNPTFISPWNGTSNPNERE